LRRNEFKAAIVNSTYAAKLPCRKFGIKCQRQTAILIRCFTALFWKRSGVVVYGKWM